MWEYVRVLTLKGYGVDFSLEIMMRVEQRKIERGMLRRREREISENDELHKNHRLCISVD